ncbi:MAG: hypothetical protein COU07_01030 [Candidatus Harrisonbacteria bacterium CG10_big_fil_rev_8_21_14_0_10_40_38]|uniref:Cell division protein FtsX n=1 Tax=Candidatus Harrisonbacteria bacterium CG10_big_fil_rev_8_21_14_0_10_40_38 TaxID=1974583 RepID=A0A2H0USS8_9BACT|nr:MAG: hypothetical protein COU07_01030 [Candidatus Harrisonbacteria bacterium CG10_big_fil_rev_8_21_14_0_10_40_38]
MVTTFFRIVKYGFQSFWRNRLLSFATVNVMILTLVVLAGLILFSALTDASIASLQDKIDIGVYFKTNVPEDDILRMKDSLEAVAEVKSVTYVSRDKALELFNEKHIDDPVVAKALEELGDNPLLASLNVKANDSEDYPLIASFLNNESFTEQIEKVTFAQTSKAIARFNDFINTIEKVGLVLIVFSAVTAALIIFNTIRLAIYSNREEINIMRLVGASNFFINGPYVIEAVIFGVIATVLSLLLMLPFISFSTPYVQAFVPEMNLTGYFYSHIFQLFAYQILFGVGLGVISASVAIRRYLKT